MNKLIAILIFYKYSSDSIPLIASCYSLSDFSFWSRSSIRESILFCCRQIIKRQSIDTYQCIQQNDYICFSHLNSDNFGYCIVATIPDITVNSKLHLFGYNIVSDLQLLSLSPPINTCDHPDPENNVPVLLSILTKWQTPQDKLILIRSELDDTRQILYKSIDQILERGEKLESIIDKTNDLSLQSKIFLKKSKQLNRCCLLF